MSLLSEPNGTRYNATALYRLVNNVNIDGILIFKSSGIRLWPVQLLMSMIDMKNVQEELIGIERIEGSTATTKPVSALSLCSNSL